MRVHEPGAVRPGYIRVELRRVRRGYLELGADPVGIVCGPFPVFGAGAEAGLGDANVRHMLRGAAQLAGGYVGEFQELYRVLFTEGVD